MSNGHYKGIGRSRIAVDQLSRRSMMSSFTFWMKNCVIHKCELSWNKVFLYGNFANWPFYESKFCLIIVILLRFCPVGVILKEICVEMHKKEFPQGQVSKVQGRGAGLPRNAQDYSAWLNPFTGLSHNLEIRTAAAAIFHISQFQILAASIGGRRGQEDNKHSSFTNTLFKLERYICFGF